MNYINITVRGKMARAEDRARIVCGNSDYTVRFDFDEEWAEYFVKTARFVYEDGTYTDVQFSGSDCAVPILRNTRTLLVGMFAGNLRTTTAALIHALPCVTDPDGTPADPTPDVYSQLMERFNEMEAPAAVLYTEQELTEEQKAQARENIRAFPAPKTLVSVADVGHPIAGGENNTMYVMDGIFTKPADPNKAEVAGLYLVYATSNPQTPHGLEAYRKIIEQMYKAGFFTWTFKVIMVDVQGHISRMFFSYVEQKKYSTLTIEYLNFGIRSSVTKNLEDNTLQYEYSGPMNIEVMTTSRGNVLFCKSLVTNLTLTEAKNLYSAMRGSLVFNGAPFIDAELTENSIIIVYMGKGEEGEYGVQKTTFDNITWKAETTEITD